MIPFLETLDETETGSAGPFRPVAVPPPWRFLGPQGRIKEARLAIKNSALGGARALGSTQTEAQKNGLRYEQKAQNRLSSIFGSYIRSPHIHFLDDSGWRTCIPDGLLVRSSAVAIFEIKSQHCPEAWWQLEKLYRIVLSHLYWNRRIKLVEVCRLFDPATPFPCTFTFVTDLKEWVENSDDAFGVWVWRP